MKQLIQRILGAAALVAGALAAPAAFAGDVGVSISVGQPGFYGRIDVGNVRPDVIYAQPMMIERVYEPAPPLYLRVPPDHYRYWARHCGYYRACGRPVYFVREDWYSRTYAPAYYGRPHVHPMPVYAPPPPPRWDPPRRDHWDGRWDGRRDWHDDRRGGWDGRRWDDRRDDHRGGGHDGHRGGWERGDRGDRGDRGGDRGDRGGDRGHGHGHRGN
ncbi:hypothetical protein [Mitsuaria sp. GD03876]|uniref:hypothetical protein n=1 Tax=Mitsuaria sp. GD03876 TaxID=2975399 RepID=UPI00244C4A15|nr:hypothetical protein [Mitsuaria sp. GD03876]MDH0866868.1 hypothetical protein [Mitsuaria sp. GD03876]